MTNVRPGTFSPEIKPAWGQELQKQARLAGPSGFPPPGEAISENPKTRHLLSGPGLPGQVDSFSGWVGLGGSRRKAPRSENFTEYTGYRGNNSQLDYKAQKGRIKKREISYHRGKKRRKGWIFRGFAERETGLAVEGKGDVGIRFPRKHSVRRCSPGRNRNGWIGLTGAGRAARASPEPRISAGTDGGLLIADPKPTQANGRKGKIMGLAERDCSWEVLERWFSGPPPKPRQWEPKELLYQWIRTHPGLASSIGISICAFVACFLMAIIGWGKAAQKLAHLQEQLRSTQQSLAQAQLRLQTQWRQLQQQTQRRQQAERACQQAQQQHTEASQQIRQCQERFDQLQYSYAQLQQAFQRIRALYLSGCAEDLLVAEPARSLLLATEAARLLGEQALSGQLRLLQTLQDAFGQLGIGRLEGQPSVVTAFQLTRDARWLITAGEDRSVRVWHLEAQKPVLVALLRRHIGAVRVLLLTPDEKHLITASDDGQILLWNFPEPNRSPEPTFLGTQKGGVHVGALSADGRWLATASSSPFQKDYPVLLWDLWAKSPASGPMALRGHDRPVRAVTFSPDLRWVITAGVDRTVRLYHLQAKHPAAEQKILLGHQNTVTQLLVSPDARWLISASLDGTARIWNLKAPEPAEHCIVVHSETAPIEALAVDSQSRWVATGSGDGTIRLWDLQAPNPSAAPVQLHGHLGPVHCLQFTPDNQRLISGSSDRTVRVWDLTASDPNGAVLVLRGHPGSVRLLALSQDGRLLVTASEDIPDTREGAVRFWLLQPTDLLPEAQKIVDQIFTTPEQQQILASFPAFPCPTR